jgi:hypothetical protein
MARMTFIVLSAFPAILGCRFPVDVDADDREWLARAVVGEVAVMRPQRELAGSWVVHVVLNRVGNPWFLDSAAEVILAPDGMKGAWDVEQVPEWAYDVVDAALLERGRYGDTTSGSLWLFGGLDITENMDWAAHMGSLVDGAFSVHLFARWPFRD